MIDGRTVCTERRGRTNEETIRNGKHDKIQTEKSSWNYFNYYNCHCCWSENELIKLHMNFKRFIYWQFGCCVLSFSSSASASAAAESRIKFMSSIKRRKWTFIILPGAVCVTMMSTSIRTKRFLIPMEKRVLNHRQCGQSGCGHDRCRRCRDSLNKILLNLL